MKALSLAFLGLLAAKAVAGLRAKEPGGESKQLVIVRGVLYVAILALIIQGARCVGYDVAAELYGWASQDNLARAQSSKAYDNAAQAVRLRPGVLRYWQVLAATKFARQQFASLLEDLPTFLALSGGKLEEEDAYRFAAAHFFLGQYDKVIPLTHRLIEENRFYTAPYVLQGYAHTAQRKYPEAERAFLDVLQIFPTQQVAVEGLAHLYFLAGNRAGALGILNETAKHPFPPGSRKRFEDLKALYAQ